MRRSLSSSQQIVSHPRGKSEENRAESDPRQTIHQACPLFFICLDCLDEDHWCRARWRDLRRSNKYQWRRRKIPEWKVFFVIAMIDSLVSSDLDHPKSFLSFLSLSLDLEMIAFRSSPFRRHELGELISMPNRIAGIRFFHCFISR